MRIRQIRGGFAIPVNNEEEQLLKLIEENTEYARKQLNDRDRLIASKLLSRGLLRHKSQNGNVIYYLNDLEDIWRD